MKKTKTRIVGAAAGGTVLIAGGLTALLTSPSAQAETRVLSVTNAIEYHVPSNASQSCKNHAASFNHYYAVFAHQDTLANRTRGTAHARHHNSAVAYGRLADHQRDILINSRCFFS